MKRHTLKALAGIASCVIVLAVLTGCSWSIGSDKDPDNPASVQPTRGKELSDLKKARDEGAISEAEYQQQKAKLLNP